MQGQKWVAKTEYILLLIVITFASCLRVLSFGFWIDDWPLLWGSFYNTHSLIRFFDHPGLPVAVFLFSHVFGTNSVLWYLFLLSLKVICEYLVSMFLYTLTKSRVAGFLSGIFFAASFAGYEVIDAISNSTALLAGILILAALIFLLSALQGKRQFLQVFFIFLIFSLFIDPGRSVAVIPILPFLLLLLPQTKEKQIVQRLLMKSILIVVLVGIPLFFFWFLTFKPDSQLSHIVTGIFKNPLYILSKADRIKNFFASIANLAVGIVYSMQQNEMDIGVYSPLFGITGIGMVMIGIISFIVYLREKMYIAGMISFFIFWICIFYLPNFLSEPRAPMAGPQRYLFLSSIGSVCLIAYLLSILQKKWIIYVLSAGFIFLNIYKANMLLRWQASYRNAAIVNNIWNTVEQDVPKNEVNDIFIFTGSQPWLWQNIDLSSDYPFLLERKMRNNYADFPVITRDEKSILEYVCKPTPVLYNKKLYSKTKIQLSHVYAWVVEAPGVLVNRAQEEQIHLKEKILQKHCI
ncbi:MAG TPA: hypothetical protein VGT05_01395 [Patescibacteria group bacterium]|nr:hypothetical protein [Patescibacteria group bacterium]